MGEKEQRRGKRIRELRGKESQSAEAERCGMSQSQWSKLERGEGPKTPFETITRIAEHYGVRAEWLRDGVEPKFMPRHQPATVEHPRHRAPRPREVSERIADVSARQLETVARVVDACADGKLSDSDLEALEAVLQRLTARR